MKNFKREEQGKEVTNLRDFNGVRYRDQNSLGNIKILIILFNKGIKNMRRKNTSV